jgi:hypothetical protein
MADGITRLIEVVGEKDFIFIVNGQEYSVSAVEAILLSPRLFDFTEQDGTRKRFDIADRRIDCNVFSDLLRFIRCEPISISGSMRNSLVLLSRSLGNRSLERMFQSLRFDSTSTSIDLNGVCSVSSIETVNLSDICSMSIEDLSMLEVCQLCDILSSENLRLESEDWLLNTIISLGSDYVLLLNFVRMEFLSEEGLCAFFDHYGYCDVSETIWNSFVRRMRKPNSKIISSIPSIFRDFGGNSYRLLYRGSRDGFNLKAFHDKVDGHSHTITLIETTKGYTFGAYLVCPWHSVVGWKGDDTMKSFLFTLKNPHNVSARTFRMVSAQKAYVNYCRKSDDGYLTWIGNCGAIAIHCDGHSCATGRNGGFATPNQAFVNDTGLNGETFFTGEQSFTVKELEIFESVPASHSSQQL